MKILTRNMLPLDPSDTLYLYNGLDAAITLEVFQKIHPQLDDTTRKTYEFSLACQAPALHMMLRGLKVDGPMKAHLHRETTKSLNFVLARITKFAQAFWSAELNPNSPTQLIAFFYSNNGFALKVEKIYDRNSKEYKVTTKREALEKLAKKNPIAAPIIKLILAAKDLRKHLSVINSQVDPDGRMRFSFNIGGTETGRWSSSKNVFNRGTNGQNIKDSKLWQKNVMI